jgi:polar amino acid transport system substrate-binding protein
MNDAGEFSGLSIFLWDNIASELGLEYSIEEYGLDEMLASIAQGKADVGVSCLSKTHKREKFNQALLFVLEDPVWRKELVKHLGK